MAESELAVLTTQCLRRRIPQKQALQREVDAWQDHRNKHHAKADWQFTTDDARARGHGIICWSAASVTVSEFLDDFVKGNQTGRHAA